MLQHGFRFLIQVFPLISSVVWAQNPSPGNQAAMQLNLDSGETVKYLLYLPENYESNGTKWPLMLFLHGRGESFGSLERVEMWGPPRLIHLGEDYPFLVVAPQCPPEDYWADTKQQDVLLTLLDHILANWQVDASRVYLSGLSMGGFGTLVLGARSPQRFAALLPISGGGIQSDASRLKNLPIWIFHGTADKTVPFHWSEEMVNALQNAGSQKVRFTSLEYVGHDSWTAAYALPDVYDWLAAQQSNR